FLIIVCSIILASELSARDAFASGGLHALGIGAEDTLNAAIEGAMLGCVALAKRAKRGGNFAQKARMHSMGTVFLLLTIATVGFKVFDASEQAGQVLLWVRCSAGLVYCYLAHLNDEQEREPVDQQGVHNELAVLVEQFENRLSGVQSSVVTLVQSVVQVQSEQFMGAIQSVVQTQVDQTVQAHAQELSALVQSVVTEVRQPVQEQEPVVVHEPEKNETAHQSRPVITLVHSVAEDGEREPAKRSASEPVDQRIKQYILNQRGQGHEPSLTEIMDQCKCSRGSAIRYRRELGEEGKATTTYTDVMSR
ncbi:MAG: hypothetical protein JO215_02070, partial [Ktedonobacteraceae bacterium]|nr:hypothetical protein [Ktedonobacteraceae bacterium]